MTEELTTQAFEYFGALAFVGILLVAWGTFVTMKWLQALTRIEGMHEARLQAEREHGKIGEAMRDTMVANTTALLSNTEVVKTLSYRGRDQG